LRAAAELKYRPNTSAQTVKSGRFQTVALILSDDPERSALFGELVIGVAAGLKQRNYRLSLSMLSEKELTSEDFIPNSLRVWHADGLLIVYFNKIPDRFVQLIEKYGIPSVWINSMQKVNCVFSDEFGAARDATKHLLDLGHRRIAYADYTANKEELLRGRCEGYRTCIQDAELPIQKLGEEANLPRSKRIMA
jgi:LacI family transcriptional regulator